MSNIQIYPRVLLANKRQRVYFRMEGVSAPTVRIQAMEVYAIKHGTPCQIHEEDRYPLLPLTKEGEGLYSIDFDFADEQRYSLKIVDGEVIVYRGYLYVVAPDLAALRALKGDTHCHTNRSDGKGYPLEVAIDYVAAGFDFLAITDHHKYLPSIECRAAISALTDRFTVIKGEEVHNKDMGYFHVVNFGGSSSVNDIIETDDAYVEGELSRIKAEHSFPSGVNPDTAAYRIFISEHIRRAGGVSILAHPFWDAYGEYNMERAEFDYHLTEGTFDAFEMFAGNDRTGNGDNLQLAYWCDLLSRGIRAPIVGASDNHDTHGKTSLFNRNFSVVFAEDAHGVPNAIRDGSCVAVSRRSDTDFLVLGEYRLVAYARFLLAEFYPEYARRASVAAEEMRAANGAPTDALRAAEAAIAAYRSEFFADGVNGKR